MSTSSTLLHRKSFWILFLLSGMLILAATQCTERKVDFSADVKPILNRKCIICHGGVRAKGGFSLLFRDEALAPTSSGKPAIIPGDPGASEMIRRLTSRDPEERMPYKHEPLPPSEIDVLTKWVRQGASWGEHWAYVPLKPVSVPDVSGAWVKNDIDRFIVDRLDREGVKPSAEADKATLLRRVSLDLIGMPAPDGLARRFLSNKDVAAGYSELVDSLLASPHFGERWAAMWMDLARYADTKGYERDDGRNIWPYRDWLIHAFNADMPYDSMLIQQIAGDLMPHPTDAQYIATAFHRNTMTNDEGGTDNEEFRTAAVMDRVNTTWEALMGTSFACVQCHSHPYDPFKHEEYYQFLAYFNDSRDEDTYADYPLLRRFNDSLTGRLHALTDWVKRRSDAGRAADVERWLRTWEPAINSLTADKFVNSELADTKWLIFRNHGTARLKQVDLEGSDQLIYRYMRLVDDGEWTMRLDSVNGKLIARVKALPTPQGWTIAPIDLGGERGVHDIYIGYENPKLTNPNQSGLEFDWFHFGRKLPGPVDAEYKQYDSVYWGLLNANVPTIPVMMDNPGDMHRASYVFERGNWLVKGKRVEPGVPQSLSAAMPANAPHNRMGMALWLTSPQHPLVARTMVNRLWEQLFGMGIAETLEDLGTQGAVPTHRELLDWMAYRFIHDDKWSIKSMLREMVMSATYRQDSKVREDLKEKDPQNRLYARGARVRLSAEQVRDQALCISGQFNDGMYGPSVFPYQPNGIWLSPWNGAEWRTSGEGQQYRRAVYTYWKRTAPYPSMMTFDGASREVCTARRVRTNTPLQALVTLNDQAYTDMSRAFALRMQREGGGDPAAAIGKGFEMMLYRPAGRKTIDILMQLYQEALSQYRKKPAVSGASAETEALTVVANAMLNLDEVITKS